MTAGAAGRSTSGGEKTALRPLRPLGWLGIVRLGLAQTALGAIFVLSTSTLNRVMRVELALPAVLPGALIALQYAVQLLRPRLGYGSDVDGRRTPMIVGGMGVLASGSLLAAVATGTMPHHFAFGLALAVLAFLVIGCGVSAAGTALLVLIATRTSPSRRPAAAAIAWIMMILGFILTAAVAGTLLDPFSPVRLILVASAIAAAGFVLTLAATWGMEGRAAGPTTARGATSHTGFGQALREIWAEPQARRFAIFVFVSMLAYGGEEVLIEPFAGSRFGMTVGQTAQLSGLLHSGSLVGMLLVALACSGGRRGALARTRSWIMIGCVGSALALLTLAGLGATAPASAATARDALWGAVLGLGVANGAYAIAAIGTMMQQVSGSPTRERDGEGREGLRMGLWGAAQAVAFGAGTLAATGLGDLLRLAGTSAGSRPYVLVFGLEAATFMIASVLVARSRSPWGQVPKRLGRLGRSGAA